MSLNVPISDVSVTTSTEYAYLDTIGRIALNFERKNLIKEHEDFPIEV